MSGQGGRGGQSGAGGAGGNATFSCGTSASCEVNAQYCLMFSPGIPTLPATYNCLTMPSACQATPTCACLQARSVAGAGTCTETAPGALRVSIATP